MAKIIWSPKAITELDRICNFISENSEYYARLFAENVLKRIEQLVLFPYSGRIVPEYNQQDLRELIYQNLSFKKKALPKKYDYFCFAKKNYAIAFGEVPLHKINCFLD